MRAPMWPRLSSLSLLLAMLAPLAALAACEKGTESPSAMPADASTSTPAVDKSGCTKPGCACNEPGASASCTVYRMSGKYIECSLGTSTCGADGLWGECDGAMVFDGSIPDTAWRLDGGAVDAVDAATSADTDDFVSTYDATPVAPDGWVSDGPVP